MNELQKKPSFEPVTMDDVMKLAEYLSGSNIVPKDFQGKPQKLIFMPEKF